MSVRHRPTARYELLIRERSYEDGDRSAATLVDDILANPEFKDLNEVIIGCWGEAWGRQLPGLSLRS